MGSAARVRARAALTRACRRRTAADRDGGPLRVPRLGRPAAAGERDDHDGLHDLTLAFILSHGKCNPEWDGERPLLGGSDEKAIESIRAAGGEVDVSFGGWSGKKLGSSRKTPEALAAAYQKVIDAYSLHAIDIDIEHGEFNSKKVRNVIEALAIVQGQNPGIEIDNDLRDRRRRS